VRASELFVISSQLNNSQSIIRKQLFLDKMAKDTCYFMINLHY
jgi:hypothetical protein